MSLSENEDNKSTGLITSKSHHSILIVLLFLLGVGVGIVISNITSSQGKPLLKEIRLQKGYKFINPLLECDANIGNYKYPNEIKRKVESYVTSQISDGNLTNAAVYYRDLNNGPWIGINEYTLFTPASLIKVPVMIHYYKKAESDQNLLAKKLLIKSNVENLISDTYVDPLIKLEIGKEYSVEELINNMIVYSDNTAYVTLKENMSKEDFEEIFNDFGIDMQDIEKSKDGDVLSIISYSSFFRILYNSSYLNRDYSEKALDLLSKTSFKEGLVSGIPSGIAVSHKFGERFYEQTNEKQLHDCGIVYMPSKPYLICIMTRGKEFPKLSQVLKGISNIIYETLEEQSNRQP